MKQRHARLIGLPTSIADYEQLLENLLKDESEKLNEEVIRIYVSIFYVITWFFVKRQLFMFENYDLTYFNLFSLLFL